MTNRTKRGFTMLVLTLAFLIALGPAPTAIAQSQPSLACAQEYTVQPGDWLRSIAARFLGSEGAWPAIMAATNQRHAQDNSFAEVANPDVIYAGWKLCVPSAADARTLLGPSVGTVAMATTEQRLARLIDRLEQRRQELHIPGMAIAVVKGDEVILTHGFGVADLEKNIPATPETVFGIGSTSKAFTSAAIAMLVDEGTMDWDDPVTNYLPYFTMAIDSDDPDAQVTIRDLLSHRTGFPRMGLLFASGQVPREEVLQGATKAEPLAGFREKFYYSNVMYTAAGVAAGKAAGSDWDSLVVERIFTPLGMTSSSTSVGEAASDPNFATGYLWDGDLESYKVKPARNVDNIAPAGAVNSTAADMAQWLRLLLGGGSYGGQALISEKQMNEMWTSQVQVAPGIGYGLGWMVRQWEGQPMIEHGGNVDGFAAQVGLLPQSGLGFVLLTNVSYTPLQQESLSTVWDVLLGDWQEDGASSAEQYAPYVGKYVAQYGPLKDKEYTTLVKNGRLALDSDGEAVYELKQPDAEGKWYFAISDQVAVSFDTNGDGQVVAMRIHQSGLSLEIPREGVEFAPEVPVAELQKYLGSYQSDQLKTAANVVIQNNRLAVDIPGQMVFELYPPNAEGKWVFRAKSDLAVSFSDSEGSPIDSLTLYQGGQAFAFARVEAERLPTVEEILALRDTEARKAALRDMGVYKVTSTVRSLQSGVEGTAVTYVAGSERYRVDSDYGKYGYSRTVVNGDRAWTESSFAPFEELHGTLLEQAKRGHPEAMYRDWRDFFDSLQLLGSAQFDGRKVYIVQALGPSKLPPVTAYVDAETGDVLRSTTVVLNEMGIGVPITTRYEGYREVRGVRMPSRAISSNEETGRTVVEDQAIEFNLEVDDQFFVPEQARSE